MWCAVGGAPPALQLFDLSPVASIPGEHLLKANSPRKLMDFNSVPLLPGAFTIGKAFGFEAEPRDDAERGRHFGYAASAIDNFVRRRSIPDRPAAPDGARPAPGRRAVLGPGSAEATLRDLGGCLAVILLSVLITLLVSAAEANATGPTLTSLPPSTWAPTSESAIPVGTTSPSPLTSRRWAAR